MKKNSKILVLGLATLFVAVVSVSLVSGSFAKYNSTVSGTDNASVAKWSFEVNGVAADISGGTFTFNLFDTIKDTAGATEEDVTAGKLAPGTSGSFELTIENTSEVNATYSLSFAETNANAVPIEYGYGGEWFGTMPSGAISDDLAIGDTATITVAWRWAYENDYVVNTAFSSYQKGDVISQATYDALDATNKTYCTAGDAYDTALAALATAPEVSITATLNVTQED